jgi:hypothetical protein
MTIYGEKILNVFTDVSQHQSEDEKNGRVDQAIEIYSAHPLKTNEQVL